MKRSEKRRALSTVVVVLVLFAGIGTARAQEARTDHDHGLEGQTLKIWQDFLQHVESIGRADVIPPAYLEQLKAPAAADASEGVEGDLDVELELDLGGLDDDDHADEAHEEHDDHDHDHDHGALVNLRNSDPIKGILFRLSGDLLDVDALFEENAGTIPDDKIREARARVEKLVGSDDPYLEDYGKLYQAHLDLQEEKFEDALAVLRSASLSTRLLPIPAREVQHGLVQANRALGDDTMAILELQLLLATLPPEEIAERTWAKEQLEEIRKEHDGPLKVTGESMLSISELLAGEDIGATTQKEQRRVEEVFEKVVKIFEADRCPACGTPKCPDCGQRQCPCPGGT